MTDASGDWTHNTVLFAYRLAEGDDVAVSELVQTVCGDHLGDGFAWAKDMSAVMRLEVSDIHLRSCQRARS